MPGRDAGVEESRVKTFCKNLFHKRCLLPSGQREIMASLVSIKAGKRQQERRISPPPHHLLSSPPKQSEDSSAPLERGMGHEGRVRIWERDPYKGNKVLSDTHTYSHK